MNQLKKTHLQMKVLLLFFLIKVYRFKLNVFDQLVNVFLFLASILLALGLSDFREKQIQKTLTSNLLKAIVNVVKNNLNILERYTPYYLSMPERLEKIHS